MRSGHGGRRACDGDARACSELAGSFGAGTATCRRHCSGWEVASCAAVNGAQFEIVKPGARDPRWATARCNDGTPFAAYVRINPASANPDFATTNHVLAHYCSILEERRGKFSPQ